MNVECLCHATIAGLHDLLAAQVYALLFGLGLGELLLSVG